MKTLSAFVVAIAITAAPAAEAQGRGRQSHTSGSQSAPSRSPSGNNGNRPSGGNFGGSNGRPGNGGVRPGNSGSHKPSGSFNRPSSSQTRPGYNFNKNDQHVVSPSTSRPSNNGLHKYNPSVRPGDNGGSNRPGMGNGNGNRPGFNNGNNNRPGYGNGNHNNGGGNKRPGMGNGNGGNRPGYGNGNRPGNGHKPDYGYGGNHGYGPRPGYDYGHGPRPGYGHHNPPPPPPRIPHGYRHPVPFFGHYSRPLPPPRWHYAGGGPIFRTILGVTLGTALDLSINSLLGAGYTITNYGPNVVYLTDVPQMNLLWPNAALYYTNGILSGSQFTYATPYYDMSRYNMLYNTLSSQYGYPVQNNNLAGVITSTWFGAGNRYVTLEFNPLNGQYYTTLSFGN